MPLDIPQKPLSHPQASQYLNLVKDNKYFEVRLMLSLNPNLVYEFDERYQTGLHWAAKRGYVKVIRTP